MVGVVVPHEQVHDGGLAAAGGPHQREGPARRQRQVEAAQHGHVGPSRVVEVDVGEVQFARCDLDAVYLFSFIVLNATSIWRSVY